MRLLSWNLLKRRGASPADIALLVERHRPDLVMMQEASKPIDRLTALLGGHYVRRAMPHRDHGPAAWSPRAFEAVITKLPVATRLDLPVPILRSTLPRHALVVRSGSLLVANVHLDHGQWTNRRQLRHLLRSHAELDMVVGDFNALGSPGLPGFTDSGPRTTTHRAYGLVPLRLDRCLQRGYRCVEATALDFGASDHRPILMEFAEVAHEAGSDRDSGFRPDRASA